MLLERHVAEAAHEENELEIDACSRSANMARQPNNCANTLLMISLCDRPCNGATWSIPYHHIPTFRGLINACSGSRAEGLKSALT